MIRATVSTTGITGLKTLHLVFLYRSFDLYIYVTCASDDIIMIIKNNFRILAIFFGSGRNEEKRSEAKQAQ